MKICYYKDYLFPLHWGLHQAPPPTPRPHRYLEDVGLARRNHEIEAKVPQHLKTINVALFALGRAGQILAFYRAENIN